MRPLGFEILLDWFQKRRAYFGVPPAPSSLWLVESQFAGTLEIAVAAPGVEAVDAFHVAAAAAGGRTIREPRIFGDRSGDYDAARVLDPHGNTIELLPELLRKRGRVAPKPRVRGA